MSMNSRIPPLRFPFAVALVVCSLLALGAPRAQAGVTLKSVRHSTDATRTRVVLDLSGPPSFRHRALGSPPRIVVEFDSAKPAGGLQEDRVGDGYVSRVRTIVDQGTLKVVLDLERPLDYSVFILTSPPRLVIDVKHGGAKAGPPKAEPTTKPTPAVVKETPVPTPARSPRQGPWVVAIDAGHGGDDPGASYHGAQEKDITLELAREVAAQLESRSGIRAVLVRKGDYFIPLRKRWDLAERMGADLFVSLHCNANEDYSARGTEVFFLSLKGASDASARELARRENQVDEQMGIAGEDSLLAEIVSDMIQTDVLMKSEHLAEECLDGLVGLGTVYQRGVKQAGFEVLKSPRMPSVLVEAAFVSNRDENKLLRDRKWQQKFGKTLAEGIDGYLRDLSRTE